MTKTMRAVAKVAICAAGMLAVSASSGAAATSLANPAAEYCIATGGFYGLRETADGQSGVCVLADGTEADAWQHFRESLKDRTTTEAPKIANPAATYCVASGGTYDLERSLCLLPDGTEIDAWAHLRDAHAASASLANPAATYCIEIGGAYEIRDGGGGQVGICRLADGTEADAWTLFRDKE